MKIKDVMTRNPSWCFPEHSSIHAALIMKEKDVGIVPVVDTELRHKLVGVVTDRDLCLAVMAMGLNPQSVQVGQAMTSDPVVCRPEDDVQKAADLMYDNQVQRVPVVDEEGIVQGMVSMADILQRSDLPSDKTHKTL